MKKQKMKKQKREKAWVYASGELLFSRTAPEGLLPLLPELADSMHYRRIICAFCRLAYDNKTLLVPGLPENPGDKRALERFETHCAHYIRKAEREDPTPNFKIRQS